MTHFSRRCGWLLLGLGLSLALIAPIQAQDVETPPSTPAQGSIRLDSVHMIAESFGQVLRITEVHTFGNSGDQAFTGTPNPDANGRQSTVFIPLPPGATGLAFGEDESPDRFVEVEGGLWDTQPVPAGSGTSTVMFSYHLIVTGGTVPLERRFSYPVSELIVATVQPGLTLQSDQLSDEGTVQPEGQDTTYGLFVGGGLAPDTPLLITFLPAADTATGSVAPAASAAAPAVALEPAASSNQRLLRGFGYALIGLAVVGLAWNSVAVSRRAATASRPSLTKNRRTRRLLALLADLQEDLESGQIDRASYERQRAEMVKAIRAE